MKLCSHLRVYEVGDQHLLLNTGGRTADMTAAFGINEPAAWLLRRMEGKDFEVEDLVEWLCGEYEVDAVISLREGSKEGEAKMPARCHAYIYTMSGLYVGEYDFEEGVNGFGVQDMDGVYLMKVIYDDGGSEVIKFMVK